MDFEDIVIGSGLAALGAVLGLEHSRSVLVLGGPRVGQFAHYDARATVPCSYLGLGGLGNAWHGVIPTGWRSNFGAASDADFAALFARFYPRTPVRSRLGQPHLFVPWRPIRPWAELLRLQAQRAGRLVLQAELAQGFALASGQWPVRVRTAHGELRARRLWLAAGALHTPGLIDRSLGVRAARETVSDHAFCYVGQVDGVSAPAIERSIEGLFFPAQHVAATGALYTLRPARFAFRRLDFGIEQRAVFGLPTGSAVAKIARRASPGLLAEAFYNRFGLFPNAPRYSVYAQVLVPDAYAFSGLPAQPLQPRSAVIRAATDAARLHAPYAALRASQRAELIIPGIHLHDTLDPAALQACGINQPGAPVQVVDASACRGIGPEHHSFKMMLAAWQRAQRAVPAQG